MARELHERYSQITQLKTPLPTTAFLPIAQPTPSNPTTRTVYKVPVENVFAYADSKFSQSGVIEGMVKVGTGVVKDSVTRELKLDKDYLDTISIPLDILDITIVGDVRKDKFGMTLSGGVITLTEDLFTIINHKRFVFLKGTTIPATGTGVRYLYLVDTGAGGIKLQVSSAVQVETLERTVVAKIEIGITGKPFSRLGLYRISRTPVGSAAPGSTGSAATEPDAFWLMEMYTK